MTLPDWQLPEGVDRGLWDYLHSGEMVGGYDEQMAASPLAKADIAFCERAFPTPGRLIDMGCGTGRLARHFAAKGYDCVGIDLSEEMLAKACETACGFAIEFVKANLVDLTSFVPASFDYAACLFSTLGMVRGVENRAKVVANAFRLLKPGGRLMLHVHNRRFHGLGWRNRFFGNGDVTMPQAYGGAPLTLHHFTRREAVHLLEAEGFRVREVRAVGSDGEPARGGAVYGYLLLSERAGRTLACASG